MLTFSSIDKHNPGLLCNLLEQSYKDLFSLFPKSVDAELEAFAQFDTMAFNHPHSVGKCVVITSFSNSIVGFASFDPRQQPSKGIIGHNCILKQFQGHGFGKLQILHLLKELERRAIQKAIVSTGDHPFFEPAQHMYLSSGFKEVRRGAIKSTTMPFTMIEYELELCYHHG